MCLRGLDLSSHHPLALQHYEYLNICLLWSDWFVSCAHLMIYSFLCTKEHAILLCMRENIDLSLPSCYRDAAFVIRNTLLGLSYSLGMRQKYGHLSIPHLFDVEIRNSDFLQVLKFTPVENCHRLWWILWMFPPKEVHWKKSLTSLSLLFLQPSSQCALLVPLEGQFSYNSFLFNTYFWCQNNMHASFMNTYAIYHFIICIVKLWLWGTNVLHIKLVWIVLSQTFFCRVTQKSCVLFP